tara:strand:- start:928 stop:1464 length:537 start_codon:yes stop_codon:yes gene_type:complete
MSEQEVKAQDVKEELVVNQDVKEDSVSSTDKAEDYSVPGKRFRELNEAKKSLENELMTLRSELKEKEVAEAEEKEDWRNLYEETKSERDKFQADAKKFQAIEQSRKERLLESFPENLREKMSALDSDTLEQMKTEFNNKVPQTDNSGGGVSGGKVLSWKDLSPEDRRKNFADIMRRKK